MDELTKDDYVIIMAALEAMVKLSMVKLSMLTSIKFETVEKVVMLRAKVKKIAARIPDA